MHRSEQRNYSLPKLENVLLRNIEATLNRTKLIRLEVTRKAGYQWSEGRSRGADVIKDTTGPETVNRGSCEGKGIGSKDG